MLDVIDNFQAYFECIMDWGLHLRGPVLRRPQ